MASAEQVAHRLVPAERHSDYLFCLDCARTLDTYTHYAEASGGELAMPNFAACELCFRSLSTGRMDIQISLATVVQISDDDDIVHGDRGLMDYRLCEPCGGYLLMVMRAMTSALPG